MQEKPHANLCECVASITTVARMVQSEPACELSARVAALLATMAGCVPGSAKNKTQTLLGIHLVFVVR